MTLLRNGEEVPPIHPGRNCEAVSQNQGLAGLEDVGCYGIYQYPPEAFLPGASLTLKVYNEDKPQDPEIVSLDPNLVCRIYKDFVPYFRVGGGPEFTEINCKIEEPMPAPARQGP